MRLTRSRKKCLVCGNTLALFEYHKTKGGRYGRHAYCKACRKKQHTKTYPKTSQSLRAYQRSYSRTERAQELRRQRGTSEKSKRAAYLANKKYYARLKSWKAHCLAEVEAFYAKRKVYLGNVCSVCGTKIPPEDYKVMHYLILDTQKLAAMVFSDIFMRPGGWSVTCSKRRCQALAKKEVGDYPKMPKTWKRQ